MAVYPPEITGLPLLAVLNWLKRQGPFVFLETARQCPSNRFSYIFVHPVDYIECYNLDTIKSAFRRLEEYSNRGYYAAGFFSYELGYGFENLFNAKKHYNFPLIWFGIFKDPIVFDHKRNIFLNSSLFLSSIRRMHSEGSYNIENLRLNISRKAYLESIDKIKEFIRQGETYQVNYTMKYKFNLKGSPYQLYSALRRNQLVSYSSFIKAENFKVLSFSPELFFKKSGPAVYVRPMKGTIERGKSLKEDKENRKNLRFDSKNNAENIMIVDLLRNDLGAVSRTGTINVPRIFTVEKYETLFQMTSDVKGILRDEVSLYELFKAIFPSGSVTGAPKLRTMQIIKELEPEPRKVYTGAVGFFSPNGRAAFNVAIRTVLLKGNKGEMGIGSGIVYDSDKHSEYKECLLKAEFLAKPRPEFQLIETMLWSGKAGFFCLPLHLKRLRDSSFYFGFCYNGERLKKILSEAKKDLNPDSVYKIRVLLYKDGTVSITRKKIEKRRAKSLMPVVISGMKTSSKDIFLRHKTTNRKLYDREYQRYKRAGCYDVIFCNEKGEITEGAISNIFIKSGRFYYTPPLRCGLLNGVFRQYILSKRKNIREKVLIPAMLKNAEGIWLANSVRGMNRVILRTEKI